MSSTYNKYKIGMFSIEQTRKNQSRNKGYIINKVVGGIDVVK